MSATGFAGRQASAATSFSRRLARLRRMAWLIDGVFRLPGTRFRFGLNSLIGITPAAGDALLAGLSLYIVFEGYRLGASRADVGRMLANVAVETAAGAVPVLGNLFDMGYKANLRNIAIIEQALGASPTV